MRLYILRHAEAEDGPVDAERELTAKGRKDSRRVGRYLKSIELELTHAFTSPLVRARQTADWVLKACPLAGRGELAVTSRLLNGTTIPAFRRWLAGLPGDASVLLVGHEPSLSALVRSFLGIASAEALGLPKGAIVRLDTEDLHTGTLKWFVGPKQMP